MTTPSKIVFKPFGPFPGPRPAPSKIGAGRRHCNHCNGMFVLNRASGDGSQAVLTLNRAFSASEDGWAMLAPYGRHPGALHAPGKGREKIVQVFTPEVADGIVTVFNRRAAEEGEGFAGLLVDREHQSYLDNGDTLALAWIKNVEARDDGLWGRLDYTDEGKRLVLNGKAYKFLSPVFDVQTGSAPGEVVPVALADATFTNKPNLRGLKPVVNRASDSQGVETETTATTVAESGDKNMEQYKAMLLKLLGLPDDASDEAIATAAAEMPEKVQNTEKELETVQNRLQALETEKLNGEADAFVAKHAAIIKDVPAVKAAYVKNKADVVAFFAAVKPAEAPPAKTLNNQAKSQPQGTPSGSTPRDIQREQTKLIGQIKNRDKCSHEVAFATAEREYPQLFTK